MTGARTLFEKIWQQHLVRPATAATPAVLYIDLHLIHEVTSPQAFAELRARGLRVRRPDRTRRFGRSSAAHRLAASRSQVWVMAVNDSVPP